MNQTNSYLMTCIVSLAAMLVLFWIMQFLVRSRMRSEIGPDATNIELISALATAGSMVYSARDQLVARGEAAVPDLIEALNSENDTLRWRAGGALVRIGQPAVPALIEAL